MTGEPPAWRLVLAGSPVSGSRSPAIHEAALAAAGMPGSYTALDTGPGGLGRLVGRLAAGEVHGINVTRPLKGEAAGLASILTPEAAGSGSVNTLRYRAGEVEGHSTDAVAARQALAGPAGGDGAPVLVLGAGGASAAVLEAARGRQRFVSSRTARSAARLAAASGAEAVPWGEPVPGAVLVNATPLGSGGGRLPLGVLGASRSLIDLPYGERPTPAVADAVAAGLPTMDGVEFLVRQGAASFAWWTGVDPDTDRMLAAARNA